MSAPALRSCKKIAAGLGRVASRLEPAALPFRPSIAEGSLKQEASRVPSHQQLVKRGKALLSRLAPAIRELRPVGAGNEQSLTVQSVANLHRAGAVRIVRFCRQPAGAGNFHGQ
jgi:hypothetical protein